MRYVNDPEREASTWSLPDLETFYLSPAEVNRLGGDADTWMAERMRDDPDADCDGLAGWYYWYGLPSCLPDSDPIGPYATEQQALDSGLKMIGFAVWERRTGGGRTVTFLDRKLVYRRTEFARRVIAVVRGIRGWAHRRNRPVPDSEPMEPYATEQAALDAARED